MKGPKQGEILLLLSNRSGKSKSEIAKSLNIDPSHLSKLFKSEILTSKIKKSAAAFFGVHESHFDVDDIGAIPGAPMEVREPDMEYVARHLDEMTATDVFKYLEDQARWHYEERSRLLKIIENLTAK